jgi:hypothetical protein
MEERKLVNDTLIVAHSRKHHGSIGYTIRDNDDVIMIKRGLNKEFLKNDIEILTLHDSKGTTLNINQWKYGMIYMDLQKR